MTQRINQTVVHYAANDPRVVTGGVETFARTLGLCFAGVEFMTPETLDLAKVRERRLPVICDNHFVTDFPPDIPVIGFQHGVAARKARVTRSLHDARLALRQRRAAARPNTVWVACAQWISDTFARLHGNRADQVIYHPVDLERFDGKRRDIAHRLILHDARSPHKGSAQIEALAARFPEFRFAGLACRPEQVPERMRGAAAFIHLSRYEGNSIVCNEAMAMDLPCLFTRVGLMQDTAQRFDVRVIEPKVAFKSPRSLELHVGQFLEELESTRFNPRAWSLRHASFSTAIAGWEAALGELGRRSWG